MPYPWAFIKNGKQWSCAETKGCVNLRMKEKSLGLSRSLMPTVPTILPQWVITSTCITTSSHPLLPCRGLILHCCIHLRGSEVYPDTVQYDCDRLFCVPRTYCPWKEKALPILPFANSQALVIHRDPVSRGGRKKKKKKDKKNIVKFDSIDIPSISVRTAEAALTFYLISSYQFLTYFLSCSQGEGKAKGEKVYTVNTYVHLSAIKIWFSLNH